MLFVSINFSLEKDFAEIFPAFVNFNIMLCNFRAQQICIRVLKCDTGVYLWYSVTKINRSVGSLLRSRYQGRHPLTRETHSFPFVFENQ